MFFLMEHELDSDFDIILYSSLILQVSHEFALNGNPQNPYCAGIPGVVQAYHTSIQSVELWGPTNFAPIINHVARFADQAAKEGKNQV